MKYFGAIALFLIVYIANIVLDEIPGKKRIRSSFKAPSKQSFGGLTKKPLLTETEQLFLTRLEKAFSDYRIFAQVQLSTFIVAPNGPNKQATLNRYNQQSVDFLLCDSKLEVIAGIELDDKSHVGNKSNERDSKKNDVFREAGIPLFRWHAEKMPTPTAIRKEFDDLLFPSPAIEAKPTRKRSRNK